MRVFFNTESLNTRATHTKVCVFLLLSPQEPDTINLEENERWLDVNVVGSLLKSFFRKLPEPMVTEGTTRLLNQNLMCIRKLPEPMVTKGMTRLLNQNLM